MNNKRVIRVISRLNIGGPAIHTILLTSALNKDGYKDTLICGKPADSEGDMISFARAQGVEPVVIPELQREISFLNDLKAFFKLYAVIKKEKPDILHTHTAKAGALGRLAGLFAGVPVKVHTFHGHIFDGYFHPVKAKIFLFIERLLALFTTRVIVVSETVKKDIVAKLKVVSEKKCSVIPLGLELNKFLESDKKRGMFRKKLGLDGETLLVGIVGRLVPIKNHVMFMDVAHKIKKNHPDMDVKFVIVGDGELRKHLEDYSRKLGLEENVIFAGWIEDLVSVYADLDVVTLTSLNEGTPVSLIEAMAAGKAILATSVGGIRDLIRPGIDGVLSGEKDIEGFSLKLIGLLCDSEERKELGRQGREAVLKKYGKERLVRDIESLYESLCPKDKT